MDQSARVSRFRAETQREYETRFPRSYRALTERGRFLLDGTSHGVRWNEPFMVVAKEASGAALVDLDGHRIVDYWQGHFSNILGHNPPLIRSALMEALQQGRGLQTGAVHEIEAEVAEILCQRTAMESARFTTSGSLATFYSVLLARSFTGRTRIVKAAGGWHGSQPFALRGVTARGGRFEALESEGLPGTTEQDILITRFNDSAALRELFEREGDRVACILLEPCLGSAGGIPASREFLQEARRLTEKHGALLISDEIITGFRFRAADLIGLHGVRPDLLVLGKIIGGGMPVAAVAGRRDVLELCTRKVGRVRFEGGTYSAHELSLVAARRMLRELIDTEADVYGALAAKGAWLRSELSSAFRKGGLPVHLTGEMQELSIGSSVVFVHPTRDGTSAPRSAEDLVAPDRVHACVDGPLLKATLLLELVGSKNGGGSVSLAHTDDDLEHTVNAVRAVCKRFERAGLT